MKLFKHFCRGCWKSWPLFTDRDRGDTTCPFCGDERLVVEGE